MDANESSPSRDPQTPEAAPAVRQHAPQAAKLQSWLRPRLRQALFNLRVWLPVLANRGIEARTVRYWGRESREGLTWTIDLPARCWQTGQTNDLVRRQYERDVRGFEQPLPTVGITLALTAVFGIVFLIFPGVLTFLFMLIVLVGGLSLLWLRSWTEEVRLTISTSREHEPQLRCPDLVVDENELYVFLPNARLAQATNEQLLEQRRRFAQNREMPTGREASSYDQRDEEPRKYYGHVRPKNIDLPPIKLVDDEPQDDPPP